MKKKLLALTLALSVFFPLLANASFGPIATTGDVKNLQSQLDTLSSELSALQNTVSTSAVFGVASTQPIAGTNYALAGSGVSGSATNIVLTSLTIPQTGVQITSAMLSSNFYITLEPGSSARQEIASCTGVTQNANGTATLTNCSRGLLPFPPYTASSTYSFPHGGGTTVIFSNPPQLYNELAALGNSETITGAWTFSSSSIPAYNGAPSFSNAFQIPDIGYVNTIASSGAPDASQSSKGLVQIATNAQIASGTATTTDGSQTLWFAINPSQYGKTYGSTPTVLSNNYGSATGTTSSTFTESYSGGNQTFTLPTTGTLIGSNYVSSTVNVQITLYGAQGGQTGIYTGGLGGKSIATISSTTAPVGTTLYYSIGGIGLNPSGTGCPGGNPNPGAGGFQDGGTGVCYINGGSSGGGGGGTWINTTNNSSTALLAAGGGSGGGSGGSGNSGAGGNGGAAQGGAAIVSGSGGLSSNGNPGTGYANTAFTTNVTTSTGGNTGNGSLTIVYTYSYNNPTEQVTSTVAGNNWGGTVTVSATTTHLSPTTTTINFAPWPFVVNNVSCDSITWGSSLAPYVIAESSASVEFGFGSTIAGNKYNFKCQPM